MSKPCPKAGELEKPKSSRRARLGGLAGRWLAGAVRSADFPVRSNARIQKRSRKPSKRSRFRELLRTGKSALRTDGSIEMHRGLPVTPILNCAQRRNGL